jgi:hypothetical protein
MGPARMFKESLTSRPELENSQGQKRHFEHRPITSGLPPRTDLTPSLWNGSAPFSLRSIKATPRSENCPCGVALNRRWSLILGLWRVKRLRYHSATAKE